ncbi:lysine--tRNA ligase [Pajaroellobacter abortibovis]|uniref:Lysine--tRNA ligase n=2 Tax=Pajaroellobacter abortibovis TaxID=1882918 RepID=A0A1L6MZN1_9BACT|nr:lysine--tRNA ligase [Pajaroellobacter abortibovis]APS00858.1 lysine--tRNA ligase [Pajaroellobacter abortibovis]
MESRRIKASRLRERQENPFANDVKPQTPNALTIDLETLRKRVESIQEEGLYQEEKVKALLGNQPFHVRGRILSMRSTGGLTFLRLRDRTGELQLLLNKKVMGEHYAYLENLDIGDIIEAEGSPTASKRGELSLETTRVRVLTKAFRPLPEKWHGLTDTESRYRQRYVDLIANPHVADVFRARSYILNTIRKVLGDAGFLEVETPTMHSLIGGAMARPFVTHHHTLHMNLFMRIAPELYLKRLLVGGLERVYEIGRCYRNEGISTNHNPEFTMLEFYQAYVTYKELQDFSEFLLRSIDESLATHMPQAYAQWKAKRSFSLEEPFARVPMYQAVKRGAEQTEIPAWRETIAQHGVQGLLHLLNEPWKTEISTWSQSSLRAKAINWSRFHDVWCQCESHGERLFVCYEFLSEPFLIEDYRSQNGVHSLPVLIQDYPFETSPLARRNDQNPHLVDRFELFIAGRELCNAFSELNDPEDQAERFRVQLQKKEKGDEEAMDFDEDYIRALEYGMPPATGFGMGIDRLTMLLTNCSSIRDVILFPLLRPEAVR